MFDQFKRKPTPPIAPGPVQQPQPATRDIVIGIGAFCFAAAAIGFFSVGACRLLSTLYNPAAALFIVGGFHAAVGILLTLYLVLGGYEVAHAAHKTVLPPAVLDGLATPPPAVIAPDAKPTRRGFASLPVVVISLVAASYTMVRLRR